MAQPNWAWRPLPASAVNPDERTLMTTWVDLMLAKGALILQDPSEQDYPCIIELQKDTCSL